MTGNLTASDEHEWLNELYKAGFSEDVFLPPPNEDNQWSAPISKALLDKAIIEAQLKDSKALRYRLLVFAQANMFHVYTVTAPAGGMAEAKDVRDRLKHFSDVRKGLNSLHGLIEQRLSNPTKDYFHQHLISIAAQKSGREGLILNDLDADLWSVLTCLEKIEPFIGAYRKTVADFNANKLPRKQYREDYLLAILAAIVEAAGGSVSANKGVRVRFQRLAALMLNARGHEHVSRQGKSMVSAEPTKAFCERVSNWHNKAPQLAIARRYVRSLMAQEPGSIPAAKDEIDCLFHNIICSRE